MTPILPFSAPRSSLNHALTPERAVAFGRVTLTAVKEIKPAYGVTVNDVVLAAFTRAFGDYFRAHGEPPRDRSSRACLSPSTCRTSRLATACR